MAIDAPAWVAVAATPLDVLILEHSQEDFELAVRTLEGIHFKVHAVRVSTREEIQNLSTLNTYDIILSDYSLPGWTGMDALRLLKEKGSDTPFILLSHPFGEEKAVQCIKEGAAGIISKTRISDLPSAVCEAISQRNIRETKERADASLRESEARFRALADSIASAVLIYQGTECRYANHAAQTLTGYTEQELLNLASWDLLHPDSRPLVIERGLAHPGDAQSSTRYEAKILSKQGDVRVWDVTMGKIEIAGQVAGLLTALDITERKLAEASSDPAGVRDSLTGLHSNAQAVNIFLGEAKRSQRTGRSFAVLLLMLDELKQINERSGYAAGSRVLCKVARIVGEVCRGADSAARFSEDEFVLILPETSLAGARRLVHRIEEGLNTESDGLAFLIRAGAAVFPQDGPTMEHALHSARRALKAICTERSAKKLARSA